MLYFRFRFLKIFLCESHSHLSAEEIQVLQENIVKLSYNSVIVGPMMTISVRNQTVSSRHFYDLKR